MNTYKMNGYFFFVQYVESSGAYFCLHALDMKKYCAFFIDCYLDAYVYMRALVGNSEIDNHVLHYFCDGFTITI